MKSLLVVSPHCTATPDWLSLQTSFLRKTTIDYDHAVVLNGIDVRTDSVVIAKTKFVNHLDCLLLMLDYCRKHKYKNYLVLDSDCFPVSVGWQERLLSRSRPFPCAAIIRPENLDLFPHPSAFFIRGEFINESWLNFYQGVKRNLLSKSVRDIGCRIPLGKCFPLLRSNVYNPHQLFAGIYYHIFYHHGAGSRIPYTRSDKYFGITPKKDRIELMEELFASPDKFIKSLFGEQVISLI